jgi:hypothetical protein
MKKLLTALATVLVIASTHGQGQVNFNNYSQNGGAGAPIWDASQIGVSGPGAAATAGLWVISGGTITTPTLIATAPFYTTPGADFLISLANSQSNDGTVTIPGVPENTTGVIFEVRAWDSSYASFDLALVANARRGRSGSFLGDVGPLNLPANNLNNMPSFPFGVVPEPSTFAFGAIGGLALLLVRRRK